MDQGSLTVALCIFHLFTISSTCNIARSWFHGIKPLLIPEVCCLREMINSFFKRNIINSGDRMVNLFNTVSLKRHPGILLNAGWSLWRLGCNGFERGAAEQKREIKRYLPFNYTIKHSSNFKKKKKKSSWLQRAGSKLCSSVPNWECDTEQWGKRLDRTFFV